MFDQSLLALRKYLVASRYVYIKNFEVTADLTRGNTVNDSVIVLETYLLINVILSNQINVNHFTDPIICLFENRLFTTED